MIDLDQDLNIFYLGGSGGFFFLHYLLMQKKHYCYFRDIEEIYNPLQDQYKAKLLKVPNENLFAYRCSKSYYEQMAGIDWPNYKEYLSIELTSLPKKILEEILAIHSCEPRDIQGIEKSEDWFDFKFEYIFNRQWSVNGRDWKKFEVWPNNDITLKNKDFKRHKIYFTVNDLEKWQKWPGVKILLWTDLNTQIRMNLYKNSGTFSVDKKFPIDTLTSVKDQIRKLKTESAEIQGIKVYSKVKLAWEIADAQIKLQDLLTKQIVLNQTIQQEDFKHKWLNLHPYKLIKKSGFL